MHSKMFCLLYLIPIFPIGLFADQGPVPPPLWCDDISLAKQAGVYEQCKKYNTTAYGKKLKLTVLYETLCPDCQMLMKDVLYPQIWKHARDFVDIELIPYGIAHHSPSQNGTYDISCQHGPKECQLNKLHSCVIHQLVDSARWFPFIYCMDTAIGQGLDPSKATKRCYSQYEIKTSEQDKINDCVNGPLGDQLQKTAADRTDSVKPHKHQFVPWIMINDISTINTQLYQNSLLGVLCTWYRGKTVPVGCQGFVHAAQQNKCMQ